MKVSVVVPVYNKAAWLEDSFGSIFEQTFIDFEVIAVDDRSTDGSLELLRGMKDPRLRVIALNRNLGPAGAAQRGMDVALGEYIVRMDADDIMLPDRIERQVEYMDDHGEVGASGGQVVLFGSEQNSWTYPLTDDACKAQLLFGVPIPQPGSILRTRVLRESGVRYLDEWPRIGEDWLFWVALSGHTRFGNIDAPVIRYRRGPQNISHGHDIVAARRSRVPLVLRTFGMEPSAEEVEAHLMASLSYNAPPDARMVRAVHRWLDRLRVFNRTAGFTSETALDNRLRKAWNDLFYRLPEYGVLPVLEHMRLSRTLSWASMSYALKVWAGKLAGHRHRAGQRA